MADTEVVTIVHEMLERLVVLVDLHTQEEPYVLIIQSLCYLALVDRDVLCKLQCNLDVLASHQSLVTPDFLAEVDLIEAHVDICESKPCAWLERGIFTGVHELAVPVQVDVLRITQDSSNVHAASLVKQAYGVDSLDLFRLFDRDLSLR